ncbi:glycoside hydrolase family 16 protein [Sphingobacterium bovistauri]|nr:glycoside hydrolase family 16 protein [Sphingobacterium bovistauri]
MFSCTTNKQWDLVWSEEFNYVGAPDATTWNFDTAGNAWGWGNNELQHYTSSKYNNAIVEDGVLKITARKEKIADKLYTSARLTTQNKIKFQYGKLEVRAKLPKGKGMWPAIWMLGQNIDSLGWPMCGEIDIMEYVGYEPDTVYATIHSDTYNHMRNTQKMKSIFIENPQAFHNYSIEWSKDKIDFYLNSQLYNTVLNEYKSTNEWPFDSNFFLLLNVAVGGNWGGKHGIDTLSFPAQMEVDYVRYYKRK